MTPVSQQPLTARQQRRLDRYHEVRSRHNEGQSLRRIFAEVGLSKSAVPRYLRSDQCPDWRPGRLMATVADGYQARIDAWLADGNRNVADLHRRLTGEGATLGYDTLRRFVTRRLALCGEPGRHFWNQEQRLSGAAPRQGRSTRSLSGRVASVLVVFSDSPLDTHESLPFQ